MATVARRQSETFHHVLDVPFALRGMAALHGARWDTARQVCVWEGADLPPALALYRSAPYSLERDVEEALNPPRAGARPRTVQPPQGEALTPRPHQMQAVEAVLRARAAGRCGFLLADDVGLGKTAAAWEAVKRMTDVATVLVVCPLAVVAHWRQTVQRMGDGGRRVVIVNYDRLGKLFDVAPAVRRTIKSRKGLARRGTPAAFDVVIWDESHRCKNPTAARSRLAARINATAGFALWLSATAGQNPLELSYLAPLLASATGRRASDLKDFEAWCVDTGLGVSRGAFGKWTWRGDPTDCERVRAVLFDGRVPVGLRRRPEDVAGWPAIHRILTPMELQPDARALYDTVWTAFRQELSLAPHGSNPRNALAAMLRLRQKGSLVRVPGTVDLALELLENGHQVAISVAFMETLTALRTTLEDHGHPCAVIHGALDAAIREAERKRFQKGDRRVVLFTVEEGISLHQGELTGGDRPRSAVVHDLRWSAIQMAQIEGRCHRDGRFAQVYWTYADGTVEASIAQVVSGRLRAMKGMVGDDVETLREIERLLYTAAA